MTIGDGVAPFRDGYDFVDFPVSIVAESLSAKTVVRSAEGPNPTSLHRFLRELADDWKGTQPDRTWDAIEHDLSIDAHRDSLGHVLLTFSLRQSYQPDAWLVKVVVRVDAGEEMVTLAREVERLLGG